MPARRSRRSCGDTRGHHNAPTAGSVRPRADADRRDRATRSPAAEPALCGRWFPCGIRARAAPALGIAGTLDSAGGAMPRPSSRTRTLRVDPGRHQFLHRRVVDGRAVPAFKASGDVTSMSRADGYIKIPTCTAHRHRRRGRNGRSEAVLMRHARVGQESRGSRARRHQRPPRPGDALGKAVPAGT